MDDEIEEWHDVPPTWDDLTAQGLKLAGTSSEQLRVSERSEELAAAPHRLRGSIRASIESHILASPWMRGSRSFGAWVIVQSTRPEVPLWRRLLWPLIANAVDLSLFLLLILSASEAIHPPCVNNSSCRNGEWCGPALREEKRYSMPGRCADCYKAIFDDDYYQGFEVDPDYLLKGKEWCEADLFPLRCDHVVENAQKLVPSTLIVLASVILILWLTSLADLDEAVEEAVLFRVRTATCPASWPVSFLMWMHVKAKMLLIPVAISAAFMSMVLSSTLNAVNVVLNGLAVTFVGTVDNLLVSAMVPRNKENEIEEAFEEAETSHHHLLETLHGGMNFNRLLITMLGVFCLAGLIWTEPLMQVVHSTPTAVRNDGSRNTCSFLTDLTMYGSGYVMMTLSLAEPIIGGVTRRCFKDLLIVDIFANPLFILVYAYFASQIFWFLFLRGGVLSP